jgi:transcriptional regulator with XRE-family HTH domain
MQPGMTFGERITKARKDKFLSREEAAARIGITRLQLNELEQDRSDPNDDMLLVRLSEVLELPLSDLRSAALLHKGDKEHRARESSSIVSEMVAFRVSREKE